ncbi:MAG: type II toxin-antitoxin system prevent-host-death family antitoxin [Thermodesulfobacteriota bacterium]|nr:type II toxin-antitoxin system prevent-host-death family antitoxin [Thermodesulfobacteriota bacterium]
MQRVNVREAGQQISRLLDAVAAGEEIVIMRRGKPTARLLPTSEIKTGKISFPDHSALRAMIPPAKLPAAELIREMRDKRG